MSCLVLAATEDRSSPVPLAEPIEPSAGKNCGAADVTVVKKRDEIRVEKSVILAGLPNPLLPVAEPFAD